MNSIPYTEALSQHSQEPSIKPTATPSPLSEEQEEEEEEQYLTMTMFVESCSFKFGYVFMLILFSLAIIGNGSTQDAHLRAGFRRLEQLSQIIFVMMEVLRACVLGFKDKEAFLFSLLMAVCTFVGMHAPNEEVSRYFLCFRTLKLRCLFTEVPSLYEEIEKLKRSTKEALIILAPTFLFVYIYAIVGLHCFGGKSALMQVSSTTGAGTPTTSTSRPTGRSTRRRSSCAARGAVRWSRGCNSSA